MKTRLPFFLFFFAVLTVSVSAQNQKSVFEKATLAASPAGSPCVLLNWKKGSENTAYYLVERSINGNEFKQVGLVFTGEDAALTDYKFRDNSFSRAETTLYYRITIVSDQKELISLPVQKVVVGAVDNSLLRGQEEAMLIAKN